jgi:23S rRNA (cytidine2498-2'-O)-methyltransferase
MIPLQSACDAVSRAWWKFETGLRWARFPIGCRTRCLDIGCAPGGASQALLARGAEVLGVDPADLPAEIKKHPNFTHLRDKIGQIRRTRFRKVRWILSDMNVAPAYTLDVIEELLSHPHIRIRGILTTLKLFDVRQAETIERYLERFRQWGFRHVRAAQLQFHRQEIGVAAQR